MWKNIREFKGGKPFLMKTKGIPSSYTFSVKNLETIKKVFKNLKQNVR